MFFNTLRFREGSPGLSLCRHSKETKFIQNLFWKEKGFIFFHKTFQNANRFYRIFEYYFIIFNFNLIIHKLIRDFMIYFDMKLTLFYVYCFFFGYIDIIFN